MDVTIKISEKLSEHVPEVVEAIKAKNNNADIAIENILEQVCKQFLIQAYSEILGS